MSDLVRRLQLLERDAKSDLNLTLPQAHALHALRSAGQLRMQELAMSLGLAQSTVTRLVAPLKRMGLLDRRPDKQDGRATCAFLTDKGADMAEGIDKADNDLYEDILGRLPETRRAEVVAAIALLHETVLDLGDDAAG
jgi:DNA-binding MarR family transcriptional regulator